MARSKRAIAAGIVEDLHGHLYRARRRREAHGLLGSYDVNRTDAGRRAGATSEPDGSTRWRVWAPRARRVDLVLVDGTKRRVHPMSAQEAGDFSARLPAIV